MFIFFSEMTVILRDRINDLLTANAELEREVARLRYAPVMVETEQHQDPEISLEQTRYRKSLLKHRSLIFRDITVYEKFLG